MKILFTFTLILLGFVLYSQTDVEGEGLMYFSSGNVGIGTSSPERAFHIQSTNGVFRIDRDQSSPAFIVSQWQPGFVQVEKSFLFTVRSTGVNNGYFEIADYGTALGGSSYISRFVISNSGNVGIGTINPSSKLSVNGGIESTEIQVKATIADYVFNEDYRLLPLEDVENFIKTNKHLPNVFSRNDQKDNNGNIPLGQISMNMLEKIEELTLYLIELNKVNKELMDRIKSIENTLK